MANTPYALPAGQPVLPSGEFLLPVCTTRERVGELLNALNFYLVHSREENYAAVIDVYRALTYVTDPFMSPCLRGGLNCRDVYPDSPSITYEPQNPFTEPDYVPAGYQAPPFFWVKPTDTLLLALNFQVGDVITDPTRFLNGQVPIPPDDFGFPRFRFSWVGKAEIELHFLQYPLGGAVLVTQDSNPLSTQVLHLNLDSISIPPETVSEIVVEREATTDGEHYIDVTFFPVLNDELPFVNYGGGLRKITICQGECMSDFDVRQNAVNPCKLEKTTDGETWEQFADLRKCKPQIRIGGGGRTEVYDPETDTWTPVDPAPVAPRTGSGFDNRCLASANAVNVFVALHGEVVSRYGIGIPILGIALGFVAAVLSLVGLWIIAAEIAFTLGGILLWSSALTMAAFSDEIKDELQCIFYCNSTSTAGVVTFDYEAIKDEIQSREGLADIWKVIHIYLLILGSDAVDRAGSTTAISEAECNCVDCPENWCIRIDLTQGMEGFANVQGGYSSGQGFVATTGETYTVVVIQRTFDFGASMLTYAEMRYDQSLGGVTETLTNFDYHTDPSVPNRFASNVSGTGTDLALGGNLNKTGIVTLGFALNCGDVPSQPGSGRIKEIILAGTGAKPLIYPDCE